jgi:RNA polymerase sigma-70 factor (ECF subfamily)
MPVVSLDHEKQWVLGIAAGDTCAFKQLFEKYNQPLYRYALRFVKSPALAEDTVQEAFVKVWEKRASLPEVQHFKAFLFTICRNQMLNLFARSARELSIQQEIIYHAVKVREDTDDLVLSHQYEAIAEEAIAKLPPQRQHIFRLCRLEGKSYEEVANELGISRTTVSDHLVKASKFLREYLSAYADFSLLLFLFPYLFLD